MAYRQRRKRRGRWQKRLTTSALWSATGLAFLLLAAIAGVFAMGIVVYASYAKTLLPPEQLSINHPSRGAKILDRHGHVLYEYVDDRAGIRMPVPLQQISPAMLAATIATEDFSFFSNPGVNSRGLLRAAWENFSPWSDKGLLQGRGGSSITQQLVKNVYIPAEDRAERSIERKLREIVYSIELTKQYDKAQILEWYMNEISYGGIYTGVEAAAQGYFGKSARDLTLAEAALLAGIPQSPARYDPRNNLPAAIERRNQVLDLMERHPVIRIGEDIEYVVDPEEVARARQESHEILWPVFPIEAPHFVLTYVVPQLRELVGEEALLRDGLVVTTSLDLELNRRAQEILNSHIARWEGVSGSRNGAAIVIHPASGEILAMVGSRNYFDPTIDGQVNNLLALNSPGSSFKPFVYLATFLNLGWTPGTTILDTPISYREVNGAVFTPQNPVRNSYAGPISVRAALGNSLNVPAFKAALQLGASPIVQLAKSMGFTGLDGYYGPSIAIGGIDLRAIDLAYGYSVLANGGVIRGQTTFAPDAPDESFIQPIAILRIEDSAGNVIYNVDEHRAERRVAPAEHTYMITDILMDPSATCRTFGCNGLQVPGYRVAVKTGTSQPFDPNGPFGNMLAETWSFGYTADWVVGIWAGNSDNRPISALYSTSIAFPAMRDIMLATYKGAPQTPFDRPPSVTPKRTCAPVINFPATVQAPGARPAPPPPPTMVCGNDLAP